MRFSVCLCACVASAFPSAYGLSISPTRIVLDDDRGAQVSIRLSGEGTALPIEAMIVERLPGGTFAEVPDSVIRIHPPQILLNPDETRNILIEISAGIAVNKSRSFYARIEELRIRPPDGGDGTGQEIVLLATYLLPVHVLGGHSETLTAEIAPALADAQIIIANTGRGPALLSSCSLVLDLAGGPEMGFDGSWLAEQLRSDAILPEETVRLQLSAFLPETNVPPPAAVVGVRAGCAPFQ